MVIFVQLVCSFLGCFLVLRYQFLRKVGTNKVSVVVKKFH
jgi:ABC-type Mn2+/Zn2+ transport system permease subunit